MIWARLLSVRIENFIFSQIQVPDKGTKIFKFRIATSVFNVEYGTAIKT